MITPTQQRKIVGAVFAKKLRETISHVLSDKKWTLLFSKLEEHSFKT